MIGFFGKSLVCVHFLVVHASMDILDVDLRHDDDVDDDHHALLDSAAALDAHPSLRDPGEEEDDDDEEGEDSGVALPDDDDDSSLRTLSMRGGSSNKRRKIGKALQLILLRKYVQCAKQLDRLPNRAMTEQLLDEGYDEFYFQGGSLNEPRLGYTAFLKLVRNRRGEVMRQTRDLQTLSHGYVGTMCVCVLVLHSYADVSFWSYRSRGSRRNQKEQLEIRTLIDELERVRQSHLRSPLDYEGLEGSDTAGSSSGTVSMLSVQTGSVSSAGHHHGVPPGASATNLVAPGALHDTDDVLISREKLDMMLRFAQETLDAQKKILDEVRAIEQRLDLNQL